jgi:outer membrane protein OmpA-like peptidoglycan-associated protein
MRTRKSVSFVASSVILAGLMQSGMASAQDPSNPFDQSGPPAPPPAQPAPGGQPGWGGQPGGAPPPAGGAPAPAPGGFGAQGGFGGEATVGAGQGGPGQWNGGASGQWGGPPPPAGDATEPPEGSASEWEERERSLINQNNILGSTGLLRTSFAGSGAEGTFRVAFITDWFTTSGFLCDPGEITDGGVPVTCSGDNREDEASHVGGFFSLNVTPLSFLEGYAQLRTYANSNSEGAPQLLQVLGDTTLGVKGFTPMKLAGFLTVGGEMQLFLLNGTGAVGPAGGGTSVAIRALATSDFRKPGGKGFPLRVNLNLGYKIDNSGEIVEEVEAERAAALGQDTAPISRIERFGLGINRVDQFQTYLGAELPFDFIQPFLEYTIDLPVNRQGYECHTGTVSRGDVCLGLTDLSSPNGDPAGFSYVPSRLSLGVRATPFEDRFRGLSGMLAFDIGVTGSGQFVEEVAPQAPWTMYLGLGYAFDVQDKPQQVIEKPAPAAAMTETPKAYVRGFVHERGKPEGIANAIVSFQGGAQPPLATGADGRFLSRDLPAGIYTFEVSAPGFKPGQCAAQVQPMAPPPPPPPANNNPGQFTPPPPPSGPQFVDIDCELEAAARAGGLLGAVKDAATSTAVGAAVVKATDAQGKEYNATADGSGNFKLENLPTGEVTLRVTADGYLTNVSSTEVRAGEEQKLTLSLNKRPKTQKVKIQGNEIKLSDKILFETDSAKILGQSSSLLEEIADVFQRNPNITSVEIQGHTDNTGPRDHNQKLSDARAASVRDWLVKAGVASSRMTPKGYGQDRPISPNVTEANKAKNRRVQFIILKK